MLLHHKLENALCAWIKDHKGAAMEGVHIIPAHATVEPTPPYLGIWCARAQPHPDFPGFGPGFPQSVPVVFELRLSPFDAVAEEEEVGPVDLESGEVHAATIAKWVEELNALLAGESGNYEGLRGALNIPVDGADNRTVKGLYITAIHPADAASSSDGIQWTEQIGFEFVAQDNDPS